MLISHRIAGLSAAIVASLAVAAGQAAAAPTTFGIAPDGFTVGATSVDGGAHPDVTIDTRIARKDPAGDEELNAGFPPGFFLQFSHGLVGSLKDLTLSLPPGLVADPTVAATCPMGNILDNDNTVSDTVGRCAPESAVGTVEPRTFFEGDAGDGTISAIGAGGGLTRLFRTNPLRGEVAAFGATVAGSVPFRLGVTVGPDGGYRIVTRLRNLNEIQPLVSAKITLWGVPADHQGPSTDPDDGLAFGGPLRNDDGNLAPRRAFTAMPAACDGRPQRSELTMASWQEKVETDPVFSDLPAATNCDDVPFDPSIAVTPANRTAGAPSGYAVDLQVPQPWTAPVGEGVTPPPATAHLKDAKVVLPEGVAISPGVADGLDACTDEQFNRESSADETCPEASRIGTVDLKTPILEEPLSGTVYLASQQSQDPQSGDMYRLFITAETEGVKIKLRGRIQADPKTGRLTTTFLDNPQLPFSSLKLSFKDGDRAPLVNPTTCGTKTATGTLASWAGQTREVSSSFDIDAGCAAGGFSPGFTAGTVNPFAGGYSPFTMSVFRNDGDQDLSKIKLDLPPGLLGALGSVPVCGDAQAAAGTCGAETRLGSTTVGVGSGGKPFSLPGTVSLAGPYKGAPFSLSIAVPAKAGPLDLGLVVVRSPLLVDAKSATVAAPVDDLPQIVGGVPLHYRAINVTLDRPGFMFNATNCSPTTINATLGGTGGAVATPSARYQPQGCDRLVLNPTLKMTYSGKADLKKGMNPKLTADLGQTFGQAGLKQVAVTLPLLSSLKPENAKALCTPAQAATRACPDASIVGRASATTPALHGSLTGPVYFVEGTRVTATGRIAKTLPKLWLKLAGDGVPLDLWADSSIDNKTKRLIATFHDIPDAPIANFKLEIDGGKNGILTATADPCTATRTATAQFDGQNGGRTIRNIAIAVPECGTRAVTAATSAGVAVRFTGIGAGKLTVSGKGIRTTRRSIKRAGLATVVAPLAADAKAQLAAGKQLTVTVTSTFDPSGPGKTVKSTSKVTIKPAKGAGRSTR